MKKLALILFLFAIPGFCATDHAEFAAKLNAKYFNLERAGIQSFQCKAENSIIDQMLPQVGGPESEVGKALTTLKTTVIYKDPNIEVRHAIGQKSAMLDSVLEGIDQTYEGFFEFWTGFAGRPLITEEDIASMRVDETGDGYQVHYEESTDKTKVTLHMDRDLLINGMDIGSGQVQSFAKPVFQQTDHGWVMTQVTINLKNAMLTTEIQVEYENVDGFPLPARSKLLNKSKVLNMNFDMTFTDYHLNRK